MVKMSNSTESDISKPTSGWVVKEGALIKTVRMTINMLTHISMALTVFVSLLYSCSTEKMTVFHLHYVLGVLGYQLFMCQGILVLSKYNSWSMYLTRTQRKHLHLVLQFLSFVLVIAGSSVMMMQESNHFNSMHGSLGVRCERLCGTRRRGLRPAEYPLKPRFASSSFFRSVVPAACADAPLYGPSRRANTGVVALIVTLISIINGIAANYAYKLSKYVFMIKFVHYVSGVLTLLLSAGALTTGFIELPFTMWIKNDNAVTGLIFITWVFTLFVTIDFWLLTGQRLRYIMCKHRS